MILKMRVNSCCFFFTLKTGTFMILVFETIYLLWAIFDTDRLLDSFQKTENERQFASAFLSIGTLIKSSFIVLYVLFFISVGLAIVGIISEVNNFLLPLLAMKILIIIIILIQSLFMLFVLLLSYGINRSFTSALIIVTFINEALLVYFWLVIYSYYVGLKGLPRDYPLQPGVVRNRKVRDRVPQAQGGYPKAQGGYPQAQGGGPPGAYGQPPPYGGNPYEGNPYGGNPYGPNPYDGGFRQPAQAPDGFWFDKDKRTGEQPLPGENSPHTSNSPAKGKTASSSSGGNDNNVPVEQK